MNRDDKAAVIDQVADQIKESQAIFALDYRGMTVAQAAELRASLREADATMRVVKNTLTERAADKAGAEDLKGFLDGPTAFTFVRGDAALAAKALATFRKQYDLLDFKGGTMDGGALTADDVLAISKLPSRDVLHGQLVGVLAHPISGLARTLNQLIQGLAVQLGQIAEQGLVSGAAPAAAAEEAPAEEAPAAEAEAPAEDDKTDDAEAPAAEAEQSTEASADDSSDADQTNEPSEGDQEKEG
jgi:large subunit ribosomal protein L10